MRIGIFGGSFNPVHRQHLAIAEAALHQQNLDEIMFVPVFSPVHKSSAALIAYETRQKLLEEALAGHRGLNLSHVEKELGGHSYTVRTVRYLQNRFPDDSFFLIIGGDSLRDLATWRSIDELVKLIEFIVVERPGFKRVSPVPGAILRWVEMEISPISSSAIRENLAAGNFVDFCGLAPRVLFLILRHNCYGSMGAELAPVLEALDRYLAELPEGLRAHIESVANEAFLLAAGAGCDLRHALLAGLAHDIFRAAPAATILEWVERAGIFLEEKERELPMLAHGAAAAALLKLEFPDLDDELMEALRFHTLPEPGLGRLAQILVIADTLDPSRCNNEREKLRRADLALEEKFARVLALKEDAARKATRRQMKNQ